ncbi:MAG: UDP-N-acetylmuramoylalanyl-D-glutamyl-2, 6-diaminopimelate--D-alanyl-D-alanine ligase, partial [Pseudomonadota bacterium]
ALFNNVPNAMRGAWAADSEALTTPLLAAIQPGDVIMVKGSLGSRMQPLTIALKDRYATDDGSTG